jgi:hypothetical protein
MLRARMSQSHSPANPEIEMGLLALQVFQVLFLWVHDWISLGRLNDVAAVRSQDTRRRLVTVTLIQSVPWSIGLCFSLLHFRRRYPDWLYDWLVISYGLLLVGQIRAGWIPYLLRPETERDARYQIMFGKTPKGGRIVIETANLDLDETYSNSHREVIPGPYPGGGSDTQGRAREKEIDPQSALWF